MPAPRAQSKRAGLVDILASQAAAKPVLAGVSLPKYYATAQLLLRQVGLFDSLLPLWTRV